MAREDEPELRLARLEQRLRALDARVARLEEGDTDFRATLVRLGDALAATHDREAMMAAVLDSCAHHLHARAGTFYLAVAGTGRLRAVATCGEAGSTPLELATGEGVAGRAAETGDLVVFPGTGEDRGAVSAAEPVPDATTAVAVPVNVGGHRYGVLALYGRTVASPFSATDVQTLAALVRQVEPAVENTYLYDDAQRLAITDGLTSLWNRRHFDLRANAEWQRANRFGDPFSVVLVDVDHFKGVNDRLGHQVGDAVLIEVAQRLVATVRDVDVVARIGGEEFGMILPNTPIEGALALVERVRTAIAGRPVETEVEPVSITVSAGIATWPDHGDSPRELSAGADAALYEAKEGGRNTIRQARPRPPASPKGRS